MLEPCPLELLQDSAACCLPLPLLAIVRGYARPHTLLVRILPPPAYQIEISAAVWDAWALLIEHFVGPFVGNARPVDLDTTAVGFRWLQHILSAWNASAIVCVDPSRPGVPPLTSPSTVVWRLERALLATVHAKLAMYDMHAQEEWLLVLRMLAVRSSNDFKAHHAQALETIMAIPVGGAVCPAHVEILRAIQTILAREDAADSAEPRF